MASADQTRELYFQWQPHDDPEFAPLICGKGSVGGKGRSLLFALRQLRDSGDEQMSRTKVPKSIYLSIEIFHQFLEKIPALDRLLANGEPLEIERSFMAAPLPAAASEYIRRFLAEMNDPVVIRSSSRLEDDVKHSFAGKYLTNFLGNNRGTLEQRACAVEDEVRRIYSRTFFPAAVDYRKRHALGDDDMGIIIIRMAGRWRGRYYYPTMAGVGYSQNFRRWTTRVKQNDGLVRMVFGMGTMSTKRGYARTVSLTNPILRPEGFAPEKIAAIAQETFHVIDAERPNELTTLDIKKEWKQLLSYHPDFAAYAQIYRYEEGEGSFSPIMKNMASQSPGTKLCFTFENFPRMYPDFYRRIKKTLKLLEEKMGLPADMEFAFEPTEDSFCLIQSRPFWSNTMLPGGIPELKEEQIILQADRMVTHGSIAGINKIVYVDYNIYYARHDFHGTARLIGELNKASGDEPYILVAPGRIGSSNPELGVPVLYSELTNCRAMVELGIPRLGFMPELSYGTHFFSDLEVDGVLYMPVFAGEDRNIVNNDWFEQKSWQPWGKDSAIRIYRGSFAAYMDGETNRGVIVDKDI
ncbi:MAG: PEP/pyruvate-binding domain-containing protein [Synergistaceae bacterium]|nr:PEP/pyruvate-binding domain-containing protein [Synergistaceae bacterium]